MSGDWRDALPENATVLSADPGKGTCGTCSRNRIVFQAHFFKEGVIRSGCKECLTAKAGGEEKIVARRIPELRGLPSLWERDLRIDSLQAIRASRKDKRGPSGPKAGT